MAQAAEAYAAEAHAERHAEEDETPMTFEQFECVWQIDEHGFIHQCPIPRAKKRQKRDFNYYDLKYTQYKRDHLGITDDSTEALTKAEAKHAPTCSTY